MKLQQRDRTLKKESSTIKRWITTPCLFVTVLVTSLLLIRCMTEFTTPKKSNSKGVTSMSKFQIQNLTVENATRPERFPTSFFNFPLIRATEYDSMYSLTPATFAYLNSSQIPQITVFFSPWCHHCQHFIPQFLEVATKYQKDVNASSVSGVQRKGPVVFGSVNCVNLRDVCMKQSIQFYPTVLVKYFPKDKGSMNPKGTIIRGSDVHIVEQYLLDNFPLYDNLTAHEVSMVTDYAGGGGNKQILDVKTEGHQGASKVEENLKRFVLMTRHGSAVCAAPQQKLQDALMSLNFLVAEEAFQAFSEAKRKSLQLLLSTVVRLLPSTQASYITGYRKILSLLSSTDSNATTTPAAAGARTPGHPKAATDLRGSPVSDFKELKTDIQAIISQMHSGMLGSQSYSWRVCGLYKPPHTAGNHSNLMTESKTHDLRSTLTESLHSAQPTIPTASAPNSSSLRLHSSTQNKSTSSTSSWSSVFHYFSSYMTPSLPAMKRTRGTTSSDSITRSGSAGSDSVSGSGSEQGYTCGLWLLLHYVTVAGGQQVKQDTEIDGRITTTEIMSSIRAFVSDLFGCSDCRDKFLAAYDKCAYRRCGIEPFDYAALQYWLYELHTSVTVNIYERKVEESRVESNTVSGVIAVPDLAIRAAHYGVRYPPNHLCNSNVGVRRHLSDISSSSSSDSSSSGSSIRIGSDVITRNLAVTKREINPMTGSKGQGMANVSRAPKPAAPIESAGRHTDVVRFLHTAYWEAGWALQTQ